MKKTGILRFFLEKRLTFRLVRPIFIIVVFVSYIHCAYVHYNPKPKARGEKAFCGWWYKSPVGSAWGNAQLHVKTKIRKGGCTK